MLKNLYFVAKIHCYLKHKYKQQYNRKYIYKMQNKILIDVILNIWKGFFILRS